MASAYAMTREAADPWCLRDGEATALLRGHPWRRLVVLGDSVAQGVGDPTDGYLDLPWADRVATELSVSRPDLVYLNLGERDLRAAEVRTRQVAPAVRFQPDLAIVACGANDALHPGYKPDVVDVELAAIITDLSARGADVVTFGILVMRHYPSISPRFQPSVVARLRQLGERIRALSARLGTIHIDMMDHPSGTDPNMYSRDGLHGNGRSHAICAAGAVRTLGAHLGNTFPSV